MKHLYQRYTRAIAGTLALAMLTLGTLLFMPPSHAGIPPASTASKMVPSLAPMLQQVMPAVVNIASTGKVRVRENPLLQDPFFRRFFNVPNQPQERTTESLGSGVIVNARKGYILTNNHVIAKANKITVTLRDGRQYTAKLIGTDPATDIAVLKIKAHDLKALPIGNSRKLRVGDFVVAIGNPFGLGQTATSGIVSALGRTGLGIEGYEDFIQTDASINPGNSGGALVNLKGQLVGINTAILSQSGGNIGIGFAIPIDMARDIMNQLIRYGEVRRGLLGVQVQDLSPALTKAFGIRNGQKGGVITHVVKGSAAAKAGLQVGDVIVAANGQPIRNAAQLRNSIGLLRIGQSVELKVLRNSHELTLRATITAPHLSSVEGGHINHFLAGSKLANIDTASPLYGKVKGVQVQNVAPGSPAWEAGLRPGDVIISANRRPVHNLDNLRRATSRKGALLLNIQRGNGALFLYLQ